LRYRLKTRRSALRDARRRRLLLLQLPLHTALSSLASLPERLLGHHVGPLRYTVGLPEGDELYRSWI